MKTVRRILTAAEIFILILILTFFVVNLVHNIKLKRGFTPSYKFDYLEALNDGTLKKKMFPYQISVQAMIGYDTQNNLITVPSDLKYTFQNEQLIIHQGEVVDIHYNETYLLPYGYGFQSYPTEKAGERAAMPFKLASEEKAIAELYHIRLSELRPVLAEYYAVNYHAGSKFERWMRFQYENAKRSTVLYNADRLLYDEGIYLSPDLFRPLLHVPLIAAAAVLGMALCGFKYFKK